MGLGIPFFSLNGLYANLGGSVTEFGPFDTFFVNPSMTWVKGKHTLKFGFDYHRFTSDFEIGWGPGGAFTYRRTYSGNPLADLLLGYPFSVTQTVYQNNNDQTLFVAPEFSAFVQDEYRITPHLPSRHAAHSNFYLPRPLGPVASNGMESIQTFLAPLTVAAVTAYKVLRCGPLMATLTRPRRTGMLPRCLPSLSNT